MATSLYDIGKWYENRGLVGEKALAITQTTIAISGKPMGFGLIAPAGCVDATTEFLTPKGWKKISEYNGELVAQYTNDGNVDFVEPSQFIKLPEKELYHFKTKYGIDQKLSSEHRVIYKNKNSDKLYEKSAEEVANLQNNNKLGFSGKIITAFNKSRGVDNFLNDDVYRLQVAISADAHIQQNGFIRFRLKKEHKKERLRLLLKNVGCKWSEKNCASQEGFTNFYVHWDLGFKIFPKSYYGLMTPQLKVMADESLFWDGDGKKRYFTSEKENADFIQYAFSASGKKATIYSYFRKIADKFEYTVSTTDRTLVSMSSRTPKTVVTKVPTSDGYKYCFTVQSGMLILREGDRIFVTGNSGKTVTMDLLVGDTDGPDDALIKKEHVYFKDAGSEKAFWYDKSMNTKKIIVFKELQKDSSLDTIEAIKSLTEGKSARRNVTVVQDDSVRTQVLDPKTVLFTYAIENKDVNFDTELARRCVTMTTDISKEQTANVLVTKATMRWDKNSNRVLTDDEANAIRRNINTVLHMNINVENPFAPEFANIIAEIAPDQKIRSMAEHFWDVMEGVTKINSTAYGDVLFVNNSNAIIANIQDLYQTLDIYKTSFLRDVHNIPPLGDVVMQGFADAASVEESKKLPKEQKGNVDLAKYGVEQHSDSKWYDINHIKKAIKLKQKVVLRKNVVISICRQLVDAGYLEDYKDGSVVKYQVQEKYNMLENPDFDRMFKAASELVKEKYPQVFDEWERRQVLPYKHPITGEEVVLK